MSYWYVFQLKDRSSKQNSRKQLYQKLRNHYGKCPKDIYICLNDINYGLNHYIFLYDTNIKELWDQLKKQKYFNVQFGYKPISQEQLALLKKDVQFVRNEVSFGDIVKINNGIYNKLNGIVLRDRNNGKYEIGLKFCYGIVLLTMNSNDFQIVDNIFKYIKIRK